MEVDPREFERAAAQAVADAQTVIDNADAVARARDATREAGAQAVLLPSRAGAQPRERRVARMRARLKERLGRIQLVE